MTSSDIVYVIIGFALGWLTATVLVTMYYIRKLTMLEKLWRMNQNQLLQIINDLQRELRKVKNNGN